MTKKLSLPTAKEINEAHRLARSSAETAVQHAIRCGQLLIEVGADQPWVEQHTEIAWSTAKRYVNAAKKNAQGIAFESLRHCFPSGQKTRAAAEKRGEMATAVAKKPSPAAEKATFPGPEIGPVHEQSTAQDLDSDDPERPDDIDEDAALASAEADYQRRVAAIMQATDHLAEAEAQIKQQAALISTLEITRDSYMRGKEAITKLLQSEQRKTARLEKELKKLQDENQALRERVAIMEAA